MEREVLLRLLDEVPGEAFVACKDAIRAGADYVVWDDTVPADQLARSYSRRAQHMAKIGTPMLGGDDAIAGAADLRGPAAAHRRGEGRGPADALPALPHRRRDPRRGLFRDRPTLT